MNNILDGGAPFYGVYTCEDGRWMSVGCIEPKFYAIFLDKFLEALPDQFQMDGAENEERWRPRKENQDERGEWPRLRKFLECGFRTNTRDYWEKVFHGMWLTVL
jgi:alpha-methylacyl-CoA racemase